MGNVLFRPEVSAEAAHTYLNLAHDLSYRQLQMLSLVHRAAAIGFDTTAFGDFEEFAGDLPEQTNLRLEIERLAEVYLLRGDTKGYALTEMGERFYELLGLDQVPEPELRGLTERVRPSFSP